MSLYQSRAPILLTAQVSVASGQNAVADSAALSSPFRKPIWINEVRWTIRTLASGGINAGGILSTRMKLDRCDVTNGFIPVWNLVPSHQDNDMIEEQADSSTATIVTFSQYRWLLPRPLFVSPGSVLSSAFQRGADAVSGSFLVTVSYAGSYAAENERPREIAVPYVTAFLPAAATAYAISGEKDLVNPFTKPLNVQRFIGRAINGSNNEMWGVTSSSASTGKINPQGANGPFTVKMEDSTGYVVIRDSTPFSSAFDINRRAWTFQRQLAPKEGYRAYIRGLAASEKAMISMIGWRNEGDV